MDGRPRPLSNPEPRMQTEALPLDVRKVIVGEEEQHEWSSCVDQGRPQTPRIKEEQEELWTNQGGAQLQGLEEPGITPFAAVAVKIEDDEEKPRLLQLPESRSEENAELLTSSLNQHLKTEAGGGSEPAGNVDPDTFSQPDTEDKMSDSSETDVSEDNWEVPGKPPSGASRSPASDLGCGLVERSFSCSECGQRFGRKPHLIAHMRIHTGEKPFSCSFCGKRFSQKGNSISHMRLHTGEKPFTCAVCKKSFRYSGDVSRHMKIHTSKRASRGRAGAAGAAPEAARDSDPDSQSAAGDEPSNGEMERSCALDPKSRLNPLRDDDTSEEDLSCNASKESFRCPECGRTFCRRDHLMSHMRTHTGEKPFSCSVCQKRFSCSGNILAHMRIHTGEKPFECSFCAKSFSQKGTLQLHVRIHTGEKPFSCPFCHKRFAHKRRMTLHMSVHTEEKRFRCGACDKRFTWYTQLKTHRCVGEPSQVRPSPSGKKAKAKESFGCSECGKTFSLKGNLKTHMRIHTGEKPFGCSVCGKSFKQNVHLTEHMTIHTGEKLYKCGTCGKGFNKKLLVKSHTCVESLDAS